MNDFYDNVNILRREAQWWNALGHEIQSGKLKTLYNQSANQPVAQKAIDQLATALRKKGYVCHSMLASGVALDV